MQKIKKYFYVSLCPFLLSLPLLAGAQGMLSDDADQDLADQTEAMRDQAGFREVSEPGSGLGEMVAVIIYAALGLLGIIFIVLIILAGFNWMMAQGEEEKVRSAKATIKNAIIGLFIVIAAYSITYFVFASLDSAGSGTVGY